jgi:protocatechuate 3,4-dioxygenase beta subunit
MQRSPYLLDALLPLDIPNPADLTRRSGPIDNLVFPELTENVIGRIGATADARVREIMELLIRHLHAFVREASLTQEEWVSAIHFLTTKGKVCSGSRQEFILLSDILGVSMLVDAVSNAAGQGLTDSTVLGPFYAGRQRELGPGDSILLRDEEGPSLFVEATVASENGEPIENASVEVWQTAPNQLYDIQDDEQPEGHLRASFRTDARGNFSFRSILPVSYPIPDDGPAGQLLQMMGRHPFRPAHVHFMISAPGHRTLVTHLFIARDAYLESDAVFGVKPSLIVTPEERDGMLRIRYRFGLQPN